MKINLSSMLSICSVMVVSSLYSPISLAGPERGVKCPAGFTSSYSGSSKILRCKKTANQYANTLCPTPPFNIYKVRKGPDKCAQPVVVNLPVTGPIPTGLRNKIRNVQCMALPGTTGWKLDTDKVTSGPGQRYKDRCKRSNTTYAWPKRR